jgi:hypothetical protein
LEGLRTVLAYIHLTIRFQVGAGIQEVFFKEKAPLGTVKENALSIPAQVGGLNLFMQ